MIVSKFGFGLLWLALAQSMPPSPAPTRDESKQALENHKKAVPRLPMPPSLQNSAGIIAKVNNGRFRTYYIPEELRESPPAAGRAAPGSPAVTPARPTDPAFSLDNTFKVKLFWISSRANDCFY